ncbi:hypothetical protein Vadar_004488 [Vaccinium darrowii]|uniref:Uncharacterized protein n=1 Tax=Vaccinium darrowii TaxID=229202 RepID=A0ACB7XN74_9ERIC|nr:hypothetical protein Vadar_004488 [Vaccinium darrowii]
MRNVILSAFPSNMRIPDPYTPNLKIVQLVQANSPRRYLFLNSAANQLRYPNNLTHFVYMVLLELFAEANQRPFVRGEYQETDPMSRVTSKETSRVVDIMLFGRIPSRNPCYLFALVPEQLVSRDDTFITCSGSKVSLRI